jgi:hypothetical protein
LSHCPLQITRYSGAFSGRFGCVLLGRNKNRWDELYDTEWQTRISEHSVGGLGKEDALRFLESAGTYHKERGDLTTADNLRKHADAILAVTREQRSQDKPSSFHPYYLDLAYGIVYEQGVHFRPADLGQTPAELQIRFLRYLQTGQRGVFETFRCLALAGTFDEALFDHLVAIRLIPAGFHFAALTGEDYSYVEEIRGSTDWRWKAASACLGPTTPTRSPSLNNLAKLYRAKGQYANAHLAISASLAACANALTSLSAFLSTTNVVTASLKACRNPAGAAAPWTQLGRSLSLAKEFIDQL